MFRINREKIIELAELNMFELSEEEIEKLLKDQSYYDLLGHMFAVNTEGVEMMHFPFDTIRENLLRPDSEYQTIDQDLAFKNAPSTDGDYFEVVQVVKK